MNKIFINYHRRKISVDFSACFTGWVSEQKICWKNKQPWNPERMFLLWTDLDVYLPGYVYVSKDKAPSACFPQIFAYIPRNKPREFSFSIQKMFLYSRKMRNLSLERFASSPVKFKSPPLLWWNPLFT